MINRKKNDCYLIMYILIFTMTNRLYALAYTGLLSINYNII